MFDPGISWVYDEKFNEVHQMAPTDDNPEDYKHICDFSLSDFDLKHDLEHGRLIAAAPKLLAATSEARKSVVDAIAAFGPMPNLVALADILTTAIMEATGESPV